MNIRKIKLQMRYLRQRYFNRQTPKAAYLLGYNFHDNLGDEAVYDALQMIFSPFAFIDLPKEFEESRYRKVVPKVKFCVLSGGTRVSGKASMVSKLQLSLRLSDRNIIFGSGVDDPEFWGQRYGDTDRRQQLEIWKTMLPMFRYVGVRGPLSLETLNRYGCGGAEVIGDPVIYLAADGKSGIPADGYGRLGLNVGNMYGGMWGTQEHADAEMIKLAALARKKGWSIIWFVVSPKDAATTRRIAEASGTQEEIFHCYNDYRQFLEKMKQIDLFVGMKLHSVALATVAYVPSVMLEYQPKCMDYMASIGQQHLVMRTDTMDFGKLYDMIEDINKRRADIAEDLFVRIQEVKSKQKATAGRLKDMFVAKDR